MFVYFDLITVDIEHMHSGHIETLFQMISHKNDCQYNIDTYVYIFMYTVN